MPPDPSHERLLSASPGTALESLRQSEKRYRMLHESLRDAFVQVSMDGRILHCNDIYCQMLGYTSDEIRTLTYIELTPERWRAFETAIVNQQIIPRGYSDVYEKEYRRKDGTIFPVELRTILSRDDQGQPETMWALVRDITDRKRTEEELRTVAAALRRSNEELEHFAYTVSHDLQAPLRNVITCTELVERRLGASLDPETQKLLALARTGAHSMRALINGLLAYALADKGDLQSHQIDLNAALTLALDHARQSILDSGAVIQSENLPTVTGDFTRLVQVLQNLITNAIQYRNAAEPPKIQIRSHSSQHECTISVTDNGLGIAPEHHAQIFQLFKRLSANHGHSGTGIGLATCKRIIERHNGRIWVESEPTQGATFHFTLPR